jgi:hypothetical protein
MNEMNWKWTLVCAATLVGATVLLDTRASAGKPAPPPPTPPVKYQVTWLQWVGQDLNDSVAPRVVGRVNDWGEVIGNLRFSDGVANDKHDTEVDDLFAQWESDPLELVGFPDLEA